MKNFTNRLNSLIQNEIDLYRLSNIMMDEDYIDKNSIPITCQFCDGESLTKHHRINFQDVEKKYQEEILEIYPDLDSSCITFWTCDNCDSVVAVKLYSHKTHQEKKIYHHKYDSFHQILKDLKEKGYLESNNKPCQCFYCDTDEIEFKKDEDRITAICKNCSKVLGYAYNDSWRIVVENDN